MSVHHNRIIELALNRKKPVEIAHRLGIPSTTVYECLRKARAKGFNIPDYARKGAIAEPVKVSTASSAISVPIRLHTLLEAEAERCNKTSTELAQSILEAGLLNKWSCHG